MDPAPGKRQTPGQDAFPGPIHAEPTHPFMAPKALLKFAPGLGEGR